MRFRHWTMIMLAGAVAALGSPAVAQEDNSAEQLGETFCAARLAGDMEPIAERLTRDLWSAITTAYDQNEAWVAANPGENPPLGDGVRWASFPDQPDECTPGEPQWEMDEARLKISYGFANAPDAAFTDTLLLRLEDGPGGSRDWHIDNLVYATDSDLRTTLLSAFMN